MLDPRMMKIVEYFDVVLFPQSSNQRSFWRQHRDLLFRMSFDVEEQKIWISGDVLRDYLREVWFTDRRDLKPEDKRDAEEICDAINEWQFAIDEQKCQPIHV